MYYFEIDHIEIDEDVDDGCDYQHYWEPPKQLGGSVPGSGTDDHLVFACNGSTVFQIAQLPVGISEHLFQTYTMYFYDGFWLVPYDATRYQVGDGQHENADEDDDEDEEDEEDDDEDQYEDWARLKFDSHPQTYASEVTPFGAFNRLSTQRANQTWPQLLLPDIYHAATGVIPASSTYGGLYGHLAILLGLIAFSVPPNKVKELMGVVMEGGQWKFSRRRWSNITTSIGRKVRSSRPLRPILIRAGTDKRGMVIRVYAYPPYTTLADLEAYGAGQFGPVFP